MLLLRAPPHLPPVAQKTPAPSPPARRVRTTPDETGTVGGPTCGVGTCTQGQRNAGAAASVRTAPAVFPRGTAHGDRARGGACSDGRQMLVRGSTRFSEHPRGSAGSARLRGSGQVQALACPQEASPGGRRPQETHRQSPGTFAKLVPCPKCHLQAWPRVCRGPLLRALPDAKRF